MPHQLFVLDVAIALSLALAGGLLAQRLRLSPIVGYFAAGLAVGPFTPGYHADPAALQQLAQVGVVFIMFGVGLHFNLRDLASVRGIALPAGAAQILIVSLVGWALATAAGLDSRQALVLGMAASISSTVVLVRALEERGLTTSIAGRVLIGWLIVQDLATIVMLVLMPVLAGANGGGQSSALLDAGRAVLFVGIALAAGPRLVPRLLRIVARTGSRELFVLVVICLSLGIAVGAELAGASLALGAFIAGIAISETETSHQAAADVLPLRDAFAVLFFVSVGMLIDPAALLEHAPLFIVAIVVISVVKPLVSGLLAASFPLPARVALLAAAGLGQAGEFSFILAEAGRSLGMLQPGTYQAILGTAALSIACTPLAFRLSEWAEAALQRHPRIWQWLDRQGEPPAMAPPPSAHVVIAGAGRVGRLAGTALERLGVPHVYIDSSLDTVVGIQQRGLQAYWGDAASLAVLQAAGIAEARLLILAVPDAGSARLAADRARELNAHVSIVARAHSLDEVALLDQVGVDAVVVPEFEGAAVILRESLALLHLEPSDVDRVTGEIRSEEYEGTDPVGGILDTRAQ